MSEPERIFYFISIIWSNLMLIPALIILGIVLSKAIKEARVHNGLIGFRRFLLVSLSSIFVLTLIALIIIDARFIFSLEAIRWISLTLLMVFATMPLIYAISKYKIYTFNFSATQQDLHKKIEVKERKTKKRDVRREVARVKLNQDRRDATVKRRKDGR